MPSEVNGRQLSRQPGPGLLNSESDELNVKSLGSPLTPYQCSGRRARAHSRGHGLQIRVGRPGGP
eukprot:765943-Hanusia_phi.AAC.4